MLTKWFKVFSTNHSRASRRTHSNQILCTDNIGVSKHQPNVPNWPFLVSLLNLSLLLVQHIWRYVQNRHYTPSCNKAKNHNYINMCIHITQTLFSGSIQNSRGWSGPFPLFVNLFIQAPAYTPCIWTICSLVKDSSKVWSWLSYGNANLSTLKCWARTFWRSTSVAPLEFVYLLQLLQQMYHKSMVCDSCNRSNTLESSMESTIKLYLWSL